MTIGAILSGKGDEVVSVRGDVPLSDAVQLLAERRIGALPVIEDGALKGVVSERDLLLCIARDGAEVLSSQVSAVMTAEVITVTADTPVIAALSLMTQRRVRHLPVLDGGRVIGFVSIGDLVKHRIDRIESEAAAMREYIASS